MNYLKKLFIYDKLVILYVIFSMLWIIISKNSIESPLTLFLKTFGVLIFISSVIIINHFIDNPLSRFLRYWYPIILLGFFFESVTKMDLFIFKEYLDPFFQHLDFMIFGYQPAVEWGLNYGNFFTYEFFYAAYFSYYVMIFGIPMALYTRSNKTDFIRALYNIMFVFVACYLVYIVLPVTGGRAIDGIKELTEVYRYGLFTHIMAFIYRTSTHNGAAFPSSHVAIAFILTFIAFRHFKKTAILMLIVTVFLSISTVFCHYHYFVDVIAGIIYSVIMFGFSELSYLYFNRNKLRI